ncbi:MAG: hypothetical protein LBD07_04710 [Spirochaetaceae bacterium]|jgi:hypothetical protein|nr:hypothetical protein [Spirochaetaceae bacterium]
MEYDAYILVDYENVQDINTDIINEKIKMLIIVGENQKKIPVSLIQMTQPYGDSVEWIQIRSFGKKNALDFFLVYFLGYYTSQYKNKEYIIYSKDTGYDPLIEYLKLKNFDIKRIVSFKQLNSSFINSQNDFGQNEVQEENILRIKENLNKVTSNKRPKSKKGLSGHIKTLLKIKQNEDIEKIIEEMFIQKIIYEENGHLKYILPVEPSKNS